MSDTLLNTGIVGISQDDDRVYIYNPPTVKLVNESLPITGGTLTGPLGFASGNNQATLGWDTQGFTIDVNGTDVLTFDPAGTTATFQTAVMLPGDPVLPLQAATKSYVDSALANTVAGYLPLTGGTLSGMLNLDVALTGAAYVSAETIQSTATGSGTNGPATAQVGLTITHEKLGYTDFTAGVGEIDGIYAHVHQSGTGNDSSVILGDLTHNGQGFASFTECNVNIMQPGTWNLLGSIHNTEAAMDNDGTFEGYGHTYTVLAGSMTTAILVQNQTGAAWNNVLQNQKNGAITYNIDDAGNVTQTGNVHIGVGSVAGTSRNLQFQTGTGLRWQIEASSDAENGGNNGSNFYLSAFDDSGAFLSQPFRIYRSSGLISVQNGLYIAGGSLTVTGAATGQTMPTGDQSTNFATTAFVANAVAGGSGGTGGIPEAPHDGTAYGRENSTWINVLPLTGGTLNGNLTIAMASGGPRFVADATSGSGNYAALWLMANPTGAGFIRMMRGSLDRWTINGPDTTAESGGNAGGNFLINRFNDAGTLIDTPFSINRATGAVTASSTILSSAGLSYQGISTTGSNAIGFLWDGSFINGYVDGTLAGRLMTTAGGTLTGALTAPQFIGTSANGGGAAAFLAQSAGNSAFAWYSTGAATDQGKWDALAAPNGDLYFRTLSDNEGTANTWLSVTRSGAAPQIIALGTSANINGNLDVVGITASGALQAQTSYINGQGAYLWWNHGNGDGGTWLANQKGGGSGGINFVETDTAANITTTYASLSAGGAYIYQPIVVNTNSSAWSSSNIGHQLIIEGPQNNAIGIGDSTGSNYIAIANSAGSFSFLAMPPLADSSSAPNGLLILGPSSATANYPWTFQSNITAADGINFNNASVSSPQDLSRHIALWGIGAQAGAYGFCVTSNTLNYNAGTASAGTHSFYAGGNLLASFNHSGSLTLGADPTGALDAATKQYVDAHAGGGGVTFNGYTTAGTFTWTKPAGCTIVTIVCYGAGGAGGGGQGSSSTFARSGGSGGGGGARITITMAAADLPATVTVTVGAGGVSAAGGNNAAGTSGAAGGTSSFGTILVAYGGGGGFAAGGGSSSGGGGGGSAGAGGAGAGSSAFGGSPAAPFGGAGSTNGGGGSAAEFGGASGGGQNPATPAAFSGGGALFAGSGGGAGGSLTTGGAGSAGGAGGAVKTWTNGTQGGGGATGATGGPGAAGTAGSSGFGGGGGAGGGAATGGTGGAGGAGGAPGGGGGGGGGGTTTGGASGAGGAGAVYVWAS